MRDPETYERFEKIVLIHGVRLVSEAGSALQAIASQVNDISNLVVEIAASAKEQATGLHEINVAVNQMDQVTQQNAAMVEQSTAASHSLSQEAQSLQASVAQFKVGTSGATPVAAPTPARAAPARQLVQALKTVGRGGAAPKPQAEAEGWEEF